MHPTLLTISEASKILGVSPSTLRRLEQNGIIPNYGLKVIYTPGGQRRYILDEIQELFAKPGFSGKTGFGKKAALLIRDFTIGFTDPNSRLSIKIDRQLETIKKIFSAAKDNDMPIIFSRTIYDPENPISFLWGEKFPSLKSLKLNTYWTDIHPILKNFQDKMDIINNTIYITDFYGSSINNHLKSHNVDTIILVGTTTSGSIRATAIDGVQRGYHVIIPQEAVGDRTETLQTTTLLDLNARYADVMDFKNVISNIKRDISKHQ